MKKRFLVLLAQVTTVCLLGAVLSFSAWADSVRDALNAAEQHWAKLYNAKDAAALAMTYTSDAMRLPPDASRAQGRAAIQAQLQKEFGDGLNNIKLQVTDTGNDGNMGWVVGNFSVDYPTQQGTKGA